MREDWDGSDPEACDCLDDAGIALDQEKSPIGASTKGPSLVEVKIEGVTESLAALQKRVFDIEGPDSTETLLVDHATILCDLVERVMALEVASRQQGSETGNSTAALADGSLAPIRIYTTHGQIAEIRPIECDSLKARFEWLNGHLWFKGGRVPVELFGRRIEQVECDGYDDVANRVKNEGGSAVPAGQPTK